MPNRSILIPFLLPCFLLSPSFTVVSGLPVVRIEDAIIFVLALGFFFENRLFDFKDPISKLLLLLVYISTISILLPSFFSGNSIVINDFMIIFMIVKYWLVFRIAASIADLEMYRKCLVMYIAAGFLCAAVGIFQFYNLFGVNNWLTPLYRAQGTTLDLLLSGSYFARVVGTNGDPRKYAYILVVIIGVSFSVAFLYRKTAFLKTIAIATCGFTALAIIYTVSRSAILGLTGGFVAIFFLLYRQTIYRSRVLLFITILGIVTILTVTFFATEYFEARVLRTDSVSFQTSLHARYRDFSTPFEDALESPLTLLFGRGPLKAVLRTSSHNDLGWMFQRFGIMGLLIYVSIVLNGLKTAMRSFEREAFEIRKIFLLSSFFTLCVWGIFLNAEDMFKNPQVMAINMFALGIIFGRVHPQDQPKTEEAQSESIGRQTSTSAPRLRY